jgi:creatinine amidohydrolase
MLVASLMWATIAAEAAAEAAHSPAYGHACEVETSLALALIPDRVRSERIGAPAPTHSVDELTDPPRPLVDEAVWLEQWSEDGALGDPRLATKEAGRRIVEVATERALAFARRLADRPLPEVGP